MLTQTKLYFFVRNKMWKFHTLQNKEVPRQWL